MSYVTDTLKQPLDMMAHSDPGTEFVTGNDVSLNPDRNFRSGLAASYSDDRIAQSAGIGQDRYMHIGEIAGAAAALLFGGEAAFGAGGDGAGAATAGGDAGAATASGGVAEGGGAVVGDAGAADTVGATGTAGLGDAGAAAAGGGDAVAAGGGGAGAATASGGASGASTATSGSSLAGWAHKAATYMSLLNAANSLANARKAAGAPQNQGVALPPPTQAPNDPDMSAIRKKNSLLFGDDSPSSTDLTGGNADQGNVGKVSLLGGTKKLGG